MARIDLDQAGVEAFRRKHGLRKMSRYYRDDVLLATEVRYAEG